MGFPIEIADVDLVEIQSLNLEDIITNKVKEAYKKLKKPVLVDDVGIFFDAWNGFPGPFIKFLYQSGGGELILKMLAGEKNRNVTIKAAAGFYDGKKLLTCVVDVKGTVATEERGEDGWAFDFVFIPEGDTRTFAQMGTKEKNKRSHRFKSMNMMKMLLTENRLISLEHK